MNDLATNTFVEKWPTWLRWVLFILAAVIVPLLIQAIGRVMTMNYLGIGSDSFILEIYSDLVIGCGVVAIGATVAPKNQFLIAVILLVFVAILAIGPLLSPGAVAYWGAITLLHAILTVGAGIATVYQLHEFQIKDVS